MYSALVESPIVDSIKPLLDWVNPKVVSPKKDVDSSALLVEPIDEVEAIEIVVAVVSVNRSDVEEVQLVIGWLVTLTSIVSGSIDPTEVLATLSVVKIVSIEEYSFVDSAFVTMFVELSVAVTELPAVVELLTDGVSLSLISEVLKSYVEESELRVEMTGLVGVLNPVDTISFALDTDAKLVVNSDDCDSDSVTDLVVISFVVASVFKIDSYDVFKSEDVVSFCVVISIEVVSAVSAVRLDSKELAAVDIPLLIIDVSSVLESPDVKD